MSASVFEVGMDADALVDKVLKEDDFPFSESLVLHPFDHHINCKVLRPSLDHIVNEKGDDMKEIIPSAINQILYEKGNNYVMSAIGDAGNIINADKILSGKGPFSPSDFSKENLWVSYEVYQIFNWLVEKIADNDNFFEEANIKDFEKKDDITRLVKAIGTPEFFYEYQVSIYNREYNNTIIVKAEEVRPGYARFYADVVKMFKGHLNKGNDEISRKNYRRGEKIILSRLAGLPVLFGGEPAEYKIINSVAKGNDESRFEFYFEPSSYGKRVVSKPLILLNYGRINKLQMNELAQAHDTISDDKDKIQDLYEEIKVAYQKLEVTYKELEETRDEMAQTMAMAGIGWWVSALFHDINNILCGIGGNGELIGMLTKKIGTDKIKRTMELGGCADMSEIEFIKKRLTEFKDNILRQTNKLGDMCENTKAYLKGEKLTAKKEEYRMSDYSSALKNEFSYVLGKGIELSQQIEYDGNICIDNQMMTRSLTNIVKNAGEAIGEDGKINLKVYKEDDFIYFDIKDNGSGIPEEIQGRIFKKMNTYGKKNGTGLGLSVAKKFIEAHDGSIEVESYTKERADELGKERGTTFKIKIPYIEHKEDNVKTLSEYSKALC